MLALAHVYLARRAADVRARVWRRFLAARRWGADGEREQAETAAFDGQERKP